MRERAVCISVQDAFNFGDSGGRLRYFISLHRKSDITVTIACSQPGVYQVLLQNRGKSYFHRIKSLCASPFTTENICVKRVLALFARYLPLKVRAFGTRKYPIAQANYEREDFVANESKLEKSR